MTDRPAPRLSRANTAPRRALPRVTPLGAGGSLPGSLHDGLPVPEAQAIEADQPTGRDLLIPNGSDGRRKSRGSAAVPTLAELMPPPEQPRKKAHRDDSAERTVAAAPEQRREHHKPGRESKGDKQDKQGKEGKDPKGKEFALEVTLSKGLRKRLKAKSAEMGLTPEETVAQLVEVWIDG
jgi:hypothetical protein